MRKIYFITVIIIILFAVNIFLAVTNSRNAMSLVSSAGIKDDYEGRAYILPIAGPNYMPILDSNIPRPEISAKSAVVYDTRSGRFLYDKESNKRLPVASLTKILSAVITIENLNLDDIVTISEQSLKVDGEKQDLYLGERMTVRNLLKLMLIESSNDAAYALAAHAKSLEADFVSLMNLKTISLGMADSFFADPAGLDDSGYSTAQDLVKLTEYSLKYREIWDISSEKTAIVESSDERIKHKAISTNRLLGLVNDIIGGKTGYTEGAGQCMILVTSVSGYSGKLISVVLGSDDRFGDTQKLIEWAREAYRWK